MAKTNKSAFIKVASVILFTGGITISVSPTLAGSKDEASQLFKGKCAVCHGGGDSRAPTSQALNAMTPNSIYKALTDGAMREMASELSDEQRQQLAEYLTGRKIGDQVVAQPKVQCTRSENWFDRQHPPSISGWGMTNTQNNRFVSEGKAKLSKIDLRKLKLKWAFSLPNAVETHSQPAIAGGAIFIGSQNGMLYALDAKNGCQHWALKVTGGIQTAITVNNWQGNVSGAEPTLYFSDSSVHAYAVNAETGKILWKTKIDNHPHARIGGAVMLYQGKRGSQLYVPVSSFSAGSSIDPNSECCKHRGSISALDTETGKIIWTSYVIPTEPVEQYKNAQGVPQFGPSGAGVWSSPAIDEKRGYIYVGTGENSSVPAENGGAVVAINMHDGSIAWSYQTYPGESYNSSCRYGGLNCPPFYKGRTGLDVSSPILLRGEDGRDIVVANNKTGDVFGLNPDAGEIVWRRRLTRGDFNWNGLHGMSVEGRRLFATVYDSRVNALDGSYWGEEELGVYAMDAFTGRPLWRSFLSRNCSSNRCRGYKAAPMAIPGILFVGAMDGYVRALDSKTGALLWQTATANKHKTLSGDTAMGGGVNPSAAVVADGMVYISSGDVRSGLPGNVILAFSAEGSQSHE